MRGFYLSLGMLGWGATLAFMTTGCANRAGDCNALMTCSGDSESGVLDGSVPDPDPPPPIGCEASPYEDASVVRDDCGVFVSASLGNDDGLGTMEAPVRTLAKALSLAAVKIPRVYACAETFEEAAQVPAGIAIYGGLECAKGWAMTELKTTLLAQPNQVPMRLLKGDKLTIVGGFDVSAKPATAPGGSSIAMIIEDVEATITRSTLKASGAADGAPGDSGGQAPDGAPAGKTGSEACGIVGLDNYPGDPGYHSCYGKATHGGLGGFGDVPNALDTQDGRDGVWDNKPGGKGGKAHLGTGACPVESQGADGPTGEDGKPGVGGNLSNSGDLLGTLSFEIGYIGAAGKGGTPGKPGGGGGGGGARPPTLCGGNLEYGASGGGGGAGGCGGAPGKGGGAGGSSIALIHLGARGITLINVELIAGNGGNGGNGGEGQKGAAGGAGAGGVWEYGCPGGKGGNGGNGGRGGGGSGGHSLGIATTIDLEVDDSVEITFGAAGSGGEGDGEDGSGAHGKAQPIGKFSK